MYSVDIWYAEHESVGDKFYKVMKVTAHDSKRSFAILQYGPRAAHVKIDSATTGTITVTAVESGTKAGQDKRAQKSSTGYRKGVKTEVLNFQTKMELSDWSKASIGKAALAEVRKNLNDPGFEERVSPAARAEPEECHLHEHKDYGSW